MAVATVPNVKASWPPKRSEDKLFRYPKPYRVTTRKRENFLTVAMKHGVRVNDLIYYNFKTRKPNEINWYLANYVGCSPPNYSFESAVYDEKKNTGVIFIPTYGDEARDNGNPIGGKLIEDYNAANLHSKEPDGACFRVCYSRVKQASTNLGKTIPPLDNKSTFGRLWGSYVDPQKTWLELPEEYRGKGAAGAMAWAGLGTIVEERGIWSGLLKPGAVVQVWKDPEDFERVKQGDPVVDIGHSFIFLHYTRVGSSIDGMVIADQGYQNKRPLSRGEYAYWVAANLIPPPPAREAGHVRYGPNP